jgi:hypothetical protein
MGRATFANGNAANAHAAFLGDSVARRITCALRIVAALLAERDRANVHLSTPTWQSWLEPAQPIRARETAQLLNGGEASSCRLSVKRRGPFEERIAQRWWK